MKLSSLLISLGAASCAAYSPSVNRRVAVQKFLAGGAAAVIANPAIANALDACPKGSKNCIRTEWTPPKGASKDEIVSTLKKALDAYPQEGQSSVDLGGWKIVEDFSGGSGRVEFKSGRSKSKILALSLSEVRPGLETQTLVSTKSVLTSLLLS
eukprot:CAMPEP_0176175250 /NCGR_PEP_ID=MMETSP0120_2-20121206/89781_1 /TAXON_ID=160619 /ORGANISM="Kryptoperidinium foliaceum, Strain CCMP 1326" /LENGTH=153 /DNA_ID=CAMNT_0017513295 /DNA_START=42 /DNA_END=503 /DNA_ORIENTATION=-